jgi:hypothetical protein
MLGIRWLNRLRRQSRRPLSGLRTAVCIEYEGRTHLARHCETFEDRLMLTVTGFGMAGDSLADEYLNETHTYAQSWVELLGEYRSGDIPLGSYKDGGGDTWGEPRRKGYEYNWGRYGATTATLLSDGQHTGLAAQITANKVSHVAVSIGPNDFLPDFSGPYFDIYFGNWSQPQIDNHVNAVVGRITTALNTVDTNAAKIILSNVLDYGLAPLTQTFFPEAARRQSVTDVIDVVNAQLLQLASDRNIPLLDLSRLAVDLLGGSSISIGGNVFTATAGVGVQNIFVADGVHPHTGTSAIIANAYLQALNSGYGESIPLFSEQELTTILSLPYSNDTLTFDFPSYVAAPPVVSLNVDNATVAEAGGVATVTATLSAVSTQIVTVNLDFSGTAADVNDYTRSATQIVIPAGSTTGSVTLTAVQDALMETDETIVVDITSVTNGNESATQQVTVAIADDDQIDFGDAPDTSAGTGTVNYNTLATDNGPSHSIVAGLFLGNTIDGDSGTLQNTRANADDVDSALPDDEDGVLDPLDLLGTVGAAPTITLLATNTTGNAATLAGWIDYNRNGVFDDDTERAQVTVPDGSDDARFTLSFPTIPAFSAGQTYARFRLSTDAAFIASPSATGAASDGEVEDYIATITQPSNGTSRRSTKIAHETNGGPTLSDQDFFGASITSLGDLDGDGITDLAVGADGDSTGGVGTLRGAVHVLLMRGDGTVKSSTKIAHETNGGPTLGPASFFGKSIASVGDLDGDGIVDLAVGARNDSTGDYGYNRGAVYVLMLNADGTVKDSTKIAHETNGGPTLSDQDYFGASITSLGDLDGDGITDLAVGADRDPIGGDGDFRGAVHVLLMNSDGTVKSGTKIASGTNGGPTLGLNSFFGKSITAVGDLDGDGVTDLAVGARSDSTGDYGYNRGAVYVLMLNSDGTAKSNRKIAHETNGGPTLGNQDYFGSSLAGVGDLDGDGVPDLAVGAEGDYTGGDGDRRGAVHVLLMNSDGTVKSGTKIASGTNGGPTLGLNSFFGKSVAVVGDLNGDGVTDLAVGARSDSTGDYGYNRGAVYVLMLKGPDSETVSLSDGGGSYEVLRDGTELIVRVKDGADMLRRPSNFVSSLEINGSPDADIVTVLENGVAVATPINFLGWDGNDRFDGSLATGGLQLIGFGGDDTLIGGSGHDSLIGESGFDVVVLRAATITATDTNLTGDGQTDGIHSVEGLLLVGSAAGSTIDASAFTSGPVTLIGSAGPDTLTGGSGDDLILAGGGRDSVSGGEGNDLIAGNSGDDTLIGDGGDDTLIGGRGRDSINGGHGADQLRGGGGPDSISGGDDDDHIRGDGGRDVLDGDDGPDTILGGGGRDNLAGGLGIDSLNGTIRDDTFSEQVGPDFQFGGIRSQARPAPARTESESAEPQTGIQHPESESAEEIDEAFSPSLLPTLLEL